MPFCNLRQGAVVIAVLDVILSGFFLLILVLGSSHAQEMACALEADIADPEKAADTESGRINNEMRLHNAQKRASATLITIYIIICVVTVHLFSSISLLCGSLMRVRQFLVPWTSVVMIELILVMTLLMTSIWVDRGNRVGYISAAISLQIYLFFWCVVWHYYQTLCAESCERTMSSDTIITEFKEGYISFPNEKAQHV